MVDISSSCIYLNAAKYRHREDQSDDSGLEDCLEPTEHTVGRQSFENREFTYGLALAWYARLLTSYTRSLRCHAEYFANH